MKSRKEILQDIRMEIETNSDILELISGAIAKWRDEYLANPQYESKTKRVASLDEDTIDELAISLVYTTILMGNTNYQSYIGHLVSQMKLDMNQVEKAKTAAEIIAVCDGLIYQIIKPQLGIIENYRIVSKLEVDNDLLEQLTLAFFTPPSLEPLLDWTTKSNGGYATDYAILGDYFNKHNEPIRLDILNKLQATEYELIPEIVAIPEEPKDDIDLEQWNKSQELCRKIYNEYLGKSFRFMWQYDKRGRIYSSGYHINPQGNSYRKAMLRFAKKEKLTNRGIYWLKVDIANNYGLDKLTFDERVNFVDKNIDDMLANSSSWISKADEPLLFKRALLAYKDGVVDGKPIGHICQLDATSSGPQIMSVLARDIVGMTNLNVLGTDRKDYYTDVAKLTYEATKDSQIWDKFNGDFSSIRKAIKKPIMTSGYNSEAKPKELFGDGTVELNAFYEALDTIAPGVEIIKNYINSAWSNVKLVHKWRTYDGHTSYCPVSKVIQSRIEVPEIQAKIVYTHCVNSANPNEWRSLSPNLIHSLDSLICRMVVASLDNVCPIHDSFGVHPNYCDDLRRVYRGCLARLYRENTLENLLTQITGNNIKLDLSPVDPEIELAIRTNDKGHYIC